MEQLPTPPSLHLGRYRVGDPRVVDFVDRPPGDPPQMVCFKSKATFSRLDLTPGRSPPQDRTDVLGLVIHLVSGTKTFCRRSTVGNSIGRYVQDHCFPIYPQLDYKQAYRRSLGPSHLETLRPSPEARQVRAWLARSPRHRFRLCIRFPSP